MLNNRSLPLFEQIVKATRNTRTISLVARKNLQLRQQQQNRQLLKQAQQQQQQQQKNHILKRTSLASIQTSLSAIKSNFYKNYSKGSVCLVLLPISTISCTAAVNLSTNKIASNSSSSSGTSKSLEETSDMASADYKNAKSIYDFTVKDTHGNDVSLEQYKGYVVLIVNIASQCGLTKNNYQKLTDLKEKYHDKGLRILNFPCNQFGSQMPEENGEAMVCHLRDAKADIGDVFQKVDVNGSNAAPIYQYLKSKQGGTLGSAIKWNFTKFLVNKEGIPVNRYAPTTDPMDIAKDIEKLL